MVTVITDKKQIAILHKRLHKQINAVFTEAVDCWVGFPSGNFEDTVKYSPELNIWISHREYETKFWNGFGVGMPREGKNNSLSGEINFAYEANNRRIAGVFAIEDNGNILVLHRGLIGGGKPGIGKNYFINNFRGDFVAGIDGDRETEFCLVGELNSTHFPLQVANFINEIYRVKHIEGTIADYGDLGNFNYTDEHSGQIVTERTDPMVIERTHGIVVNALAKELQNIGYQIGNDKNRDLFIHKRNKIETLFEIKTASSTQCLYAAVGQLIIYSMPIKNEVALIAVLPEKLNKVVEKQLVKIGIRILYYSWEKGEPAFENLKDFC